MTEGVGKNRLATLLSADLISEAAKGYRGLRQLSDGLVHRSFVQHVATLVTGTALAQAIPVLVSPVLARLYGPTDFGLLGLYVSILLMMVAGAMGSYELAILLPADDTEARQITWLAVRIALATGLLALATVALWGGSIARLVGDVSLRPWLYILPVNIVFTCLSLVLSTWTIRRKGFRRVAGARITQAGVNATLCVALGLYGFRTIGLMLGFLAGTLAGVAVLGWQVWREDPAGWWAARGGLLGVARRYRDFPRFTLPGTLVNNLAAQLPALLLSRLFGAEVLGFYAFTNKILNVPVNLLCTSVSDVFRQRASREVSETGDCRRIYIGTTVMLTVLALPPAVLMLVFGPDLFGFVFGEQWRTAGEYAQILSVLLVFRFVVSPLSYVLLVYGRQRVALVWQVVLVIVTATGLGVGAHLGGAKGAIAFFAGAYCLMYAVNLMLTYRLASGHLLPGAGRAPWIPQENPVE